MGHRNALQAAAAGGAGITLGGVSVLHLQWRTARLTLRRRTLHRQQAPPTASSALISRRPFSLRGPRRPPLPMDVLRVETCLVMESWIRSLRLGWRDSGWFGMECCCAAWDGLVSWADGAAASGMRGPRRTGKPGKQRIESSSVEERWRDDGSWPGAGCGLDTGWTGPRRDIATS